MANRNVKGSDCILDFLSKCIVFLFRCLTIFVLIEATFFFIVLITEVI